MYKKRSNTSKQPFGENVSHSKRRKIYFPTEQEGTASFHGFCKCGSSVNMSKFTYLYEIVKKKLH